MMEDEAKKKRIKQLAMFSCMGSLLPLSLALFFVGLKWGWDVLLTDAFLALVIGTILSFLGLIWTLIDLCWNGLWEASALHFVVGTIIFGLLWMVGAGIILGIVDHV